jgi:hypothetical protein
MFVEDMVMVVVYYYDYYVVRSAAESDEKEAVSLGADEVDQDKSSLED